MKRLMILCASLAACGDDFEIPDPVDMTFCVAVTELENTCDDRPLREAEGVLVDAYLRVDGSVELFDASMIIPGPYSFPNLRPHGGRLEYDADRYASRPDKTYPYRIEGAFAMDGIDVTLTERWYHPGDLSDCVRKVRIAGKPRGFLDPASLDGIFEIKGSYHGVVCGTDAWPAVPLGERVYKLDVRPGDGMMVLSLAGAVFLEASLPAADGAIDWDGTVWLAGVEGIAELHGGLHGRFAPGEVAADLTFRTLDLGSGCRHAYRLTGAKRSAAGDEVGSDYRAVYRVRDGCEGTVATFEGRMEMIRQGPGEIEVIDEFGDWFIDAEGASLSETDGSPSEGLIASFNGTAEPPFASYTLEFASYDTDGAVTCTFAWDVDAVVRYHPEFEWTPAYEPDPPEPETP